MSLEVTKIDSVEKFRKHADLMRYYAEEFSHLNDPSWKPFTEDQHAEIIFAEDPVGSLQRWAATIVHEHQNPDVPKIKIL